MKRIILISALLLSACGGGSSNNTPNTGVPSQGTTTPNNELIGTWVYASGGHNTGSACGLDVHGGYEVRSSYIFTGNAVTATEETCLILKGNGLPASNVGGFVKTDSVTGSYNTGGVYLTFGGDNYKTMDVTTATETLYVGYSVTGDKLKFAEETTNNDGSSPAKRPTKVGYFEQPVFTRQ